MKKWQILAVVIISAITIWTTALAQNETPWYEKLDYVINTNNGQTYHVKYEKSDLKPLQVDFYDPYTSKRLTDADVASYKVRTPELEKTFLDFLYKEVHYAVDTNKDGKPDVLHTVKMMPTRYVNNDFIKAFGSQGLLDEIRKAVEQGLDVNKVSFTKERQVLVTVKVDTPPFDGIPDYAVWDIRHNVPKGEDNYGGDGQPDDIIKLADMPKTPAPHTPAPEPAPTFPPDIKFRNINL